MWPLPNTETIKMQRVAHLLNELPLKIERKGISVEIKADSIIRAREFESIMKRESLCFKSFPSSDNILVHIGDEDYMKSVRFSTNQSLIIVPLASQNKKIHISEIPLGAYILQENEVQIDDLEQTFPSTFISIGSAFLEILKTINKAIGKFNNTSTTNVKSSLKKCEICIDLEVIGDISYQNPKSVLTTLEMNILEAQMNYILYQKSSSTATELNELVISNYITNLTTVFIQDRKERIKLGSLLKCDNISKALNSSLLNESELERNHIDSFNPKEVFHPELLDTNVKINGEMQELFWELKSEIWVAIGLTMSTLGILLSMAILTFILVRICMDDVLEGNPIGSVVMLIALIAQFTSFFPFTIEYKSADLFENDNVMNSMCIIKLFLVSVSYCLTFSLLLSRAIMLASIGSEGGFLSHVNGYIQSIICFFCFIVQLGLSIQLLIVMHANSKHLTCFSIYNGNWFWAVVGYDGFILIVLLSLSPFMFKSQRNYHEGILMVITTILCIICWIIWIPLSMIDNNFREIMISLGVQSTAWVILAALMVPRCYLIVKSIARSDFTQALPSLTSLAFAQANQFISEPSIYECVNPTLRSRSIGEESDQTNLPNDSYLSPSEAPTLPLRSGRRNMQYSLNFNEIINTNLPSPNKMTRF
ncbi:protein bride of sevenless [Chironomus tepperi]|uniref:protein bride of sevenless n=1 Tax=Chironomus tepperi TaxID=113505 RepID=UPI00391F84B5